jgi:O-antigen biosynthesis protein
MKTFIKLVDIELSQPIQAITGLAGYAQVRGLVRLRHRPLGWVEIPVTHGNCRREAIGASIFPHYTWQLQRELVQDYLLQPGLKTWRIEDCLAALPAVSPAVSPNWPLLTVAYCLGGPTDSIDHCAQLQAIQALDYPALEVLVIEALPADTQLAQLVANQFPQFHYHRVLEPGLNAARNLALTQAQGEYIAWLEPHTHPEPQWAQAIAETFAAHPQVDAITGLTIPHQLNDRLQAQAARHYALERGFEPQHYHWRQTPHWSDLGTGKIGSGANFACRRSTMAQIGPFDPALDLPGCTEGGGDLEWFARALFSGATLRYEPRIVAYWSVPKDHAAQLRQGRQQLCGFYSAIASGITRYPQYRRQWLTLGAWRGGLSLMRLVRTYGIPRSWSWNELKAALGSWGRYAAGLRYVAALPPQPVAIAPRQPITKHMAVRTIDLDQPLPDLTDITDYAQVRCFLQQGNHIGAKIDLQHQGEPVSRQDLARAIAEQRLWPLLAQAYDGDMNRAQRMVEADLQAYWLPPIAPSVPTPIVVPVVPTVPIPNAISIIIPTCDRLTDLTNCLNYLSAQQTHRTIEIIVADNRPQSGLTPPVVAQFPGVIYVAEPRAGASYARNKAIAASHNDIIVMIDDDVTIPPDWLEKLLAPFAQPHIAAVTGNVLPIELDSPAQWICEDGKGGLSAGWQRFEVDQVWLESFPYAPPIWDLGVSANAAFRASLFADPNVGLMSEVLGPGTPCGAGEEMYLFYRILRAGHTLVYEPSAHVWHRHRQTMAALRKQQHHYMRSASAFQLLVWQQDGDRRAVRQIFKDMPIYLGQYVWQRLKGEHQVPWSIVSSEVYGYFIGFLAYYQSTQRVKQLGRSAPYIPPADRAVPPLSHQPDPRRPHDVNPNDCRPSDLSPLSQPIAPDH